MGTLSWGGVVVFGELGALGLVLPRVALEVGERVERRRRESEREFHKLQVDHVDIP